MSNLAPELAERLNGCAVLPPMNDDKPCRQERSGEPGRRRAAADRNGDRDDDDPKSEPSRRRTRDRFELLNGFVDFTAGKLNRSELLVWLTLYRDTRDELARTAQADIARRTGLGERTVRWALDRLEGRGLLAVVQRGGLRRGPSTYRVRPLEKPPG